MARRIVALGGQVLLNGLVVAHLGEGVVNLRESMREVPPLGIIGEDAIREAFAGDFLQLGDLLRGKLRELLKIQGAEDPYVFMRALFIDRIVVEVKGKLVQYPYTVDGVAVTFGEPAEVLATYIPAKPEPAREAQVAHGAFLEASEDPTKGFRIRVIRAGLSGNGNYYPDAVLREAVSLFEGCRVFVKSDEDHLAGKGKDVRALIGALSNVAFVEGQSADSGEIHADLRLIQPKGTVATQLREAWDQQMAGLFGFSIDAMAATQKTQKGGRAVREALKFIKVKSVDLIVEPGAGGEIISVIEAAQEKVMDRTQIIALLEATRGDLLRGKDVNSLTDGQLADLLREAMQSGGTGPVNVTQQDLKEAVRMAEARAEMRSSINGSTLPQAAKDRLVKQFEGQDSFTVEQVTEAVKNEAAYLAQFGGGQVRGLGDPIRIEGGETRREKVAQMLEAFFDPAHKDNRLARSFKDVYVAITGDTKVSGQARNCDESLMREALGTDTLSDVLGNAIHRRMIADYRAPDQYGVWRDLVTIGNAVDFRSHERARIGGYGDLPKVAERGAYNALATPDDEKVSIVVEKRGGTESISIEAIKNDDVSLIRQIPVKLSRAAKRTLAKFVLDFIKDNPAVYDGKTFFHADHGNLLSLALDKAGYKAARLAMLKQTELTSADRIGIGPRHLLVSADLEDTAADLFRRNTENDKTFIQSLAPNIIPVWYWTDPNDWAVLADKFDIPTIEVDFLDGNEEPELFVQDLPNVGSMFSNDVLTWKIRHIYGGAVTDFRGGAKSVVAA